jgi:hypothetical protein
MAYRVNVKGTSVECDTVEEAKSLANSERPIKRRKRRRRRRTTKVVKKKPVKKKPANGRKKKAGLTQ